MALNAGNTRRKREESIVLQRCRAIALVALALVALPALAQDQVELKWKFEKDKPFYQTLTTDTKQTMKVMGMDISQNQSQTFILSWTPKEQDKDGKWTVAQKIEAVKMDIEIGGNKIQYDSTKDTTSGNPLAEFFKALVGSEFRLTFDKDMKVTKIEGREEFVKKLVAANQQMEPLLKQILSEEALREMSDPAFAAAPGKAVKKGESWSKDTTLNMGPIGSYKANYTYTFEGMEGKLAKLKADTKLTYQPPGQQTAGVLPFTIKSADLKSTQAGGTILFNPEAGRQESMDQTLKLAGKLTIAIGGMDTDVELNQEQKTTVKTSAENPVKK
jgi:Family of unknown function (DUF6263)